MFNIERSVNQVIWHNFMDEIYEDTMNSDSGIIDNEIFTIKRYDWSDNDDNDWHFYHKPSDLKIQWYKYPLRSPHSNKEITHEQFYAALVDCYNFYWARNKVFFDYGSAGKWWE